MLPNGLPRSRRLHLKRDFERIIQSGLKYHTSGLVLWGEVSHQAGPTRFAVVVSKKLGPAVVRNRTKRILREAFRTLPVRLKPGANLIVKPQDSEKLSNVQAARMALMSLCEKAALLGLFSVAYACVRPLLGPRNVCRFTPSCSQYARLALQKHGAFKGSWLACKRVLKCHPFHAGGYDPVP